MAPEGHSLTAYDLCLINLCAVRDYPERYAKNTQEAQRRPVPCAPCGNLCEPCGKRLTAKDTKNIQWAQRRVASCGSERYEFIR